MLHISDLPALNATLNGLSGVLLLLGYREMRRGEYARHKRFMLAAMCSSTLFLISYVIYHANTGSRPFAGTGPVRALYFLILVTHIILAATILPLALVTTGRGLRSQFERHRKIARWTFPLWMYVSVTGVVIYLMLYQIY